MKQFYELEAESMKKELVESFNTILSIGGNEKLYTKEDSLILEKLGTLPSFKDILVHWDNFSKQFLEQVVDEALQLGLEGGYDHYKENMNQESVDKAKSLWNVNSLPTAKEIFDYFQMNK